MATSLGTESIALTKEIRTWRINIETPLGADYVLTAHRELVLKNGDSVVGKSDSGVVVRALSKAASDQFTCSDGTVLSVAHIAEALAGLIDRWEEEDLG